MKTLDRHTTLSRRGFARNVAITAAGGAIIASGLSPIYASAAAAQVSQSAAKYQTTPKDKAQCDNCASFIAPSACKTVSGTISPSGWCSLHVAKH